MAIKKYMCLVDDYSKWNRGYVYLEDNAGVEKTVKDVAGEFVDDWKFVGYEYEDGDVLYCETGNPSNKAWLFVYNKSGRYDDSCKCAALLNGDHICNHDSAINSGKSKNIRLATPDDFAKLRELGYELKNDKFVKIEAWKPKRGEVIEGWNDGNETWVKGTYLGKFDEVSKYKHCLKVDGDDGVFDVCEVRERQEPKVIGDNGCGTVFTEDDLGEVVYHAGYVNVNDDKYPIKIFSNSFNEDMAIGGSKSLTTSPIFKTKKELFQWLADNEEG